MRGRVGRKKGIYAALIVGGGAGVFWFLTGKFIEKGIAKKRESWWKELWKLQKKLPHLSIPEKVRYDKLRHIRQQYVKYNQFVYLVEFRPQPQFAVQTERVVLPAMDEEKGKEMIIKYIKKKYPHSKGIVVRLIGKVINGQTWKTSKV